MAVALDPLWLEGSTSSRTEGSHHDVRGMVEVLGRGLQPEWRNIDGIKGPLGPSHCKEIVRGKEWGELAKHGVNGIVTVVAGSRVFWGVCCKGEVCGIRRTFGENAVEDTKWVLQCMSSK